MRNYFINLEYRFRHWFFQWKLDEEGDLALVIAGHIALIKYKEHTIVEWLSAKTLSDAPKHVTE